MVTVAFNNVEVIEAQARLVTEHVEDLFRLTVVDNSPSRNIRRRIRAACARQSVDYLRVPRNPYTGRDPSFSHGEALNYICHHLPSLERSEIIGFIDHDILPIGHTSITSHLADKRVYGRVIETPTGWHLWPGFLFVRTDGLRLRHLDFRPLHGVGDTGVRLFQSPTTGLEIDEVQQVHTSYKTVNAGDLSRSIELHDEWVHVVSASGWSGDGMRNDLISAITDQSLTLD